MPRDRDAEKSRLERFIIESIQLDALLDARVRDIEFINAGGEVFYSPDHSTWSAFFFPVRDGQEHKDRAGSSIAGFAQVYRDSDASHEPFMPGSPLTGNDVTGMLGKILIDAIFSPQTTSVVAPEFFLTQESKEGLNQAIEILLIAQGKRSRDAQLQRALANVFQSLKEQFSSANNDEDAAALYFKSPHLLNRAGTLPVILDDENPINLNERATRYNDVAFFDWSYIESQLKSGHGDASTFYLDRADVREFNRRRREYSIILQAELPRTGASKIASMSELLALNITVRRAGRRNTRFSYITNARWAVRDFDQFIWDPESQNPLQPAHGSSQMSSVSALFVRSPLCFLHDIELRPEGGEAQGALKTFMDTIVPRRLHDSHRLDPSYSKSTLIRRSIQQLDSDERLLLYVNELDKFYARWATKKSPWVNSFLEQRSEQWSSGLKLFSKEGFHSFWRQVNRDFARQSWQFGIYLGMMTEDRPARAAPLVFIDCDPETNRMLSTMQSELTHGDVESFHNQFDEFINRPARGESQIRRDYFDAIVNSILFMFSNQFDTTRANAEIACDLAGSSTDPDVTGREAFYLRSHLVRVTAKDRAELEVARKLMLVARSKLSLDNEKLPKQQQISTIRFDLEDWSRRIVTALADYYESRTVGRFPVNLLRDFISFARDCAARDFGDVRGDERATLLEQICERMKFNFLVLAVTIDGSHGSEYDKDGRFLESVVLSWNENVGVGDRRLAIKVDERELSRASTIEAAYLLALAAGASNATFVEADLDVASLVAEFFGEENRDVSSIKSALTSFVDTARYDGLRSYCASRLRASERSA